MSRTIVYPIDKITLDSIPAPAIRPRTNPHVKPADQVFGRYKVARLVRLGQVAVGTVDEGRWFDDLDGRRVDVDAAVAACLDSGDVDTAVQLGAALWPYWVRRAVDGRHWLDRVNAATAAAPASPALAVLRYGAGLAAFRHGDGAASRSWNEAALRIADECVSPRGRALALVGLSRVSLRDGDHPDGLRLAIEAEREATAAGDEALRTTALHMRAELTRAQGAYADAVPLYERLLEADERAGDPRSLAMELGRPRGEVPAERALFRVAPRRTPRAPFEARGSPVTCIARARWTFGTVTALGISPTFRSCGPVTCAPSPCGRRYRLPGRS